jgi:tetratricopeptide (TPR) repeat protein
MTFFLSIDTFSQKDIQMLNKGLKAAQNGNTEKAMDYFNKSLELKPNNVEAYFNKGLVYEQSNKFSEAIELYNNAIKLSNDQDKYLIRRGYCYYKIHSLSLSLKDLNVVLERDPKNIEAIKKRVDVY